MPNNYYYLYDKINLKKPIEKLLTPNPSNSNSQHLCSSMLKHAYVFFFFFRMRFP